MFKVFTLGVLLACMTPCTALAGRPVIWGIDGAGGVASSLYLINPSTGEILKTVGATGKSNLSGLALNPQNSRLYSLQGNQSATQDLVKLNKRSGVAITVGPSSQAIADTAFRSDGAFFAYGAASLAFYSVNLTSGALTTIKPNAASIGNCGLTFGAGDVLFLTRANNIVRLDPATGNTIGAAATLFGDTTTVSHLLATRPNGVIYAGFRNGTAGPTVLYSVNPATGETTELVTVALGLSGFTFDSAAVPTFSIRGGSTITTSETIVTLRGTYNSILPCTFKAKEKTSEGVDGTWRLRVPVNPGTNEFPVRCIDALGQRVSRRVTVIVTQ